MILCDTGVLLCLVDRTQSRHSSYRRTVSRLTEPLLTTLPCLTEAMYLALGRGGYPMQAQLGGFIVDETIAVFALIQQDFPDLLRLMEKYRDRPMDFADASLVVAAERTGIRQILTTDSDFLFYRLGDRSSFEVVVTE